MAIYCRHPYIHLRARSYLSLRSGGSILLSKAGPFLASGEVPHDLESKVRFYRDFSTLKSTGGISAKSRGNNHVTLHSEFGALQS